jgi:hypothetical protein
VLGSFSSPEKKVDFRSLILTQFGSQCWKEHLELLIMLIEMFEAVAKGIRIMLADLNIPTLGCDMIEGMWNILICGLCRMWNILITFP